MGIVHDERRTSFYGIVFGVWFLVAAYAIAHDQYLVRIAPDHFTVYHDNPEGIESATVLAAWIALKASVSPGLLLGIVTWFVARIGRWPKIEPKCLLVAVSAVIFVTELSGLASGALAFWAKFPLYPRQWYPDLRSALVVAQTIQITCYFVAFLASGAMLLMLGSKRMHLERKSIAEDSSGKPLEVTD